MASSLIATIILANLVTSEQVQCINGYTCSCQIPGLCQLYCTEMDKCKGSNFNLFCYPNYPCEIHCGGESTCSEATINNYDATDMTLICSGTDSCKGSSGALNCGTGSCNLNCAETTACEDLGVNTNNAKSFHCIGNCPNNIPNDYTSKPTYTPTKNPSVAPTVRTINPTIWPTNNPSITTQPPTQPPSLTAAVTTYNATNSSVIMTLECEDNNLGKCNMENINKTDQNVYIEVSFSFTETIVYNLYNMECFLYTILSQWFAGLNHVDNINLCGISNVGGIQTNDDNLCSLKPCLVEINKHNYDVNTYYDVNATVRIKVTSIGTYNAVNSLKFRLLREDLQNIFMETFNIIHLEATITLDYFHEIVPPQQLNKIDETIKMLWILSLLLGIVLCVIVCIFAYHVYKSCLLRQKTFEDDASEDSVQSNVHVARISSQSNMNAVQLQTVLSGRSVNFNDTPVISVRSLPSSKHIIATDEVNDCFNENDGDKVVECSSSDFGIDTNIIAGENELVVNQSEIHKDLQKYFNTAMMDVKAEEHGISLGENDCLIQSRNASISMEVEPGGIGKKMMD